MKRGFRIWLMAALLFAVCASVSPAATAPTPKPGRYDPSCSQGYHSMCGEGVFIVRPGAPRKIEKFAVVPWPNNPSNPGSGICGRDNPLVKTRITIRNGKFTYSGTASGKSLTWIGKWTSAKRMNGTVKWAGCGTLVKYTAKWISAS